MKLHILSDLHLNVDGFEAPRTDADVVILAGDIARPAKACDWALQLGKPVIYVAGNHEFYGGSIDTTLAELRALAAGTALQLLECDECVIGGVRFLGTTLWTDFHACGGGPARELAMSAAQLMIRDFTRIQASAATAEPFTPAMSAAFFDRNATWLDERLDAPFAGPTVVVTHHAPTLASIHPRFAGSPINAGFVSDAAYLLGGKRTPLWIHGHTHDSFDYDVRGTRVVCNPRGYAKHGVNENAAFDPGLVVEV